MMGTYDMSRVHEANLTILKKIDRICRKYNIRYIPDAGTLIGAIRRRGFTPWDSDADVAFARNQYEAFMRAALRELPDIMEFLEPDSYRSGEAFYDFTPKIIYKKSKCHEGSSEMQYYEGKLNHVWMDLLILDKPPSSRVGAEFIRFSHKTMYGMVVGYRYKLDFGKYSMVHKIFVGELAVVGRLMPMKPIFVMQEAAALKDRRSKGSLCYHSNYQPDYLYMAVDEFCCDQAEDVDFEDTRPVIPKGWHQALTGVYKNYMEMPSEGKRVPAHSGQQIRIFDQNMPEQGADTCQGDDGREIDSIF